MISTSPLCGPLFEEEKIDVRGLQRVGVEVLWDLLLFDKDSAADLQADRVFFFSLDFKYGISGLFHGDKDMQTEDTLQYTVVEQGPVWVVGLEERIDPPRMAEQIPALWDRMEATGIIEKLGGTRAGLYSTYEGDHTSPYNLIVGAALPSPIELPEGFVMREMPEAKCAKFVTSNDLPKEVVDVWMWVWQSDLNRAFQHDLELYKPEGNAEVYIEIG